MLMERDVDGRMRRTQDRPLPAGRLQPLEAFLFGAGMVAAGLAWLALLTTPAATLLAAGALVGYLFLYTPLKRRTPLSTWVGAVPGALPPVIGWAAASGSVPAGAWALFAILYLWQIPHFMAIAWLMRDDYRRAGLPVLSVVDPDGGHVGRQAARATAGLILASLLPMGLGMAGALYAAAAVILGVLFLRPVLRFAHGPSEGGARKVLLGSIVYLPLLLAALTVAGTLLG
jgi:protoheme IX farnesyltransferase